MEKLVEFTRIFGDDFQPISIFILYLLLLYIITFIINLLEYTFTKIKYKIERRHTYEGLYWCVTELNLFFGPKEIKIKFDSKKMHKILSIT